MPQIKISVRIPHLEKEYDVNLPDHITSERLYQAILDRAQELSNNDGYELYAKHVRKKIYPDYQDKSLETIGVKEGETIIVKRDEEAG